VIFHCIVFRFIERVWAKWYFLATTCSSWNIVTYYTYMKVTRIRSNSCSHGPTKQRDRRFLTKSTLVVGEHVHFDRLWSHWSREVSNLMILTSYLISLIPNFVKGPASCLFRWLYCRQFSSHCSPCASVYYLFLRRDADFSRFCQSPMFQLCLLYE
jgi:hypothetical protein